MHMSNQEICYFVFQEDVSWVVEFDHHDDLKHLYPTFEEAREAARRAAKARWLMTGNASCVRIGAPSGVSEPDLNFR